MHDISYSNTLIPSQNPSQKTAHKIPFTDLTVRNLKPESKRQIFWFKGMQGFGIRISPKGRKSWIYMFQFNNKPRMMTLGRYPKMTLSEARILYSKASHKKDLDLDPAKENVRENQIERDAITVKELSVKYIDYCIARGEVSWKEKQRSLNKDLMPFIGDRKAKEISFKDIAPIIHSMHVERQTTTQAQRLLSHTRCMFKYAKNFLGIVEFNPCADLEAPRRKKKPKHALNTKDIYQFWNNIDYTLMTPVVRLALKFMLCTLARGIEVRKMKWREVNLKDKTWFIPSENAKNGRAILIPLNKYACDILNEIEKITGHSHLVFGHHFSMNSTVLDKSKELSVMGNTAFSHAMRDNFDLLNIENKFTPHDLRKTGATCLTSVGYPREWVSKLLNHAPSNITAMAYDAFGYFEEKKAGTEALSYILDRVLSSKSVELVPSLHSIRKEFFTKKLIYRFLENTS